MLRLLEELPMTTWPLQSGLKAMRTLCGNPDANGDGSPDPSWVRKYLTTIAPPFPMFYAGKPVRMIAVNRGCARRCWPPWATSRTIT
jgi:hypothetical protein